MYIGGDFLYVDGILSEKMISFDGAVWDTMPEKVPLFQVSSFQRYQGDLYVGGNGGMAIWNGHHWRVVPCDGGITIMEPWKGKLLVAGVFDTLGGVPIHSLALWDGQNPSDPFDIDALPLTSDYVGLGAAVSYKGELYVGGNFPMDDARDDVMRWDGHEWRSLGDGLHVGPMEFVTDMVVYHDELYVTGNFSLAGGSPGNRVAKWDGSQWSAVGEGLAEGQGHQLFVYNDKLILGGAFYHIGNVYAPFLASWDGSKWCKFGGELDNAAFRMCDYKGELYVSGAIRVYGGDSIFYIAKWAGGDDVDTCIKTMVGLPDETEEPSITIFPNPTHSALTLSLPLRSPATVEIHDLQGRTALPPQPCRDGERLDVSALPAGLYLLQVRQRGAPPQTIKFIKF